MEDIMLNSAIAPPDLVQTPMGPTLPSQRAADLEGIASLPVRDLFGDIAREIYLPGDDLTLIRRSTEEALASVDMSMIKPDDKVNLLCSEHGFALMGGEPYAEMVKTIKDVVIEKTGCNNIRLRFCCGEGLSEARQMIPQYGLDEYFDRIVSTWPFDKGVAIETDVGTLYGLKRVYDADWIIHTCYSDPREVWFHRGINRILKTFTMAYARYETRSAYHVNFSSRSSNIIPRAIFESPFVQERFAFVCALETSPAGITGILADNDLHSVNRVITKDTLKSYGKLTRLFAEIDECVAILDGMRWPWYIHGGGLVSGTLFKAPFDYFNLDISGRSSEDPHLNPAIKALVINYAWRNAFVGLIRSYPTFAAGKQLAEGLPKALSKYGTVSEDLESAVNTACEEFNTDKVIVFDGSYGGINLSPSLGQFFLERAHEVSKKVDEELLPMWLSQRGLSA
jgi:hypothetical protein